VKLTLSPADAAKAAAETFASVTWRDLSGDEILRDLPSAARDAVAGKRIHDWAHCAVAIAARCDVIVTLNQKDFESMVPTTIKVVSPAEYLVQ